MINPVFIIQNLKLRPNLYVSHNYEAVTAYISGMLYMYSEHLRDKDTRYQVPDFINREIKDWYAPKETATVKELVKQQYLHLNDEELTFKYVDIILAFFEDKKKSIF